MIGPSRKPIERRGIYCTGSRPFQLDTVHRAWGQNGIMLHVAARPLRGHKGICPRGAQGRGPASLQKRLNQAGASGIDGDLPDKGLE